MNRHQRRPLAVLLGILLLAGPGCNSSSSPLVPSASPTPGPSARIPVTMSVAVPDGTASLEVIAKAGDVSLTRTITTFSAAALRTKAVAQVGFELPAGRAELQFTARDARSLVLVQNTTAIDVSASNTSFQVILNPGSASPEPTASPTPGSSASPSPGASASSSVPPFLGGPSPTPGASASASPSPGASASASPSASASVSPSPSATASASPSPSPTPTPLPQANNGIITTFAGSGASGLLDGTGTAAQFSFPAGMDVDNSGNIYLSDMINNAVRKITPAGEVTTIAGNGARGYVEGTGTAVRFDFPLDVKVDQNGNLVVADCNNNRVRLVTPSGVTSVIAGSGGAGLVDGTGTGAQIATPQGLAIAGNGDIYVAATDTHAIRKITPAGVVTTFAGGTQGFLDGTGTGAQFKQPRGLVFDGAGNLLVMDGGNNAIRKITLTGVVTTFVGGTQGTADGTGTAAQFNTPYHAVFGELGMLYVTDGDNHLIRKVTSSGVVTTLAGSTGGFADGTGISARFATPYGITFDGTSTLFISEFNNQRVRKSR